MGTMSLFGESTDDVDMIPVPNLPDLSEDDKLKDEKGLHRILYYGPSIARL